MRCCSACFSAVWFGVFSVSFSPWSVLVTFNSVKKLRYSVHFECDFHFYRLAFWSQAQAENFVSIVRRSFFSVELIRRNRFTRSDFHFLAKFGVKQRISFFSESMFFGVMFSQRFQISVFSKIFDLNPNFGLGSDISVLFPAIFSVSWILVFQFVEISNFDVNSKANFLFSMHYNVPRIT